MEETVMELELHRFIKKEEEGKYLSVNFQVPEQVETMEFSYSYDKKENIVDFGAAGEHEGFIGWSGSNRSRIRVSHQNSSSGFANVSIRQGQWQILLGAYKICPQGVQVTCRVKFQMKSLRMFKGDTHIHSCASDGNMSVKELELLAEKEGLDYLFLTDHNNYAHNDSISGEGKVKLLPGVEWTTYRGHAGMLGKARAFWNFISNSEQETREIFRQAKERGSLIVLNHPFCPDCGWKWGMEAVPWDLLEVWNGGTKPSANESCLKWWDEQLHKGKKIAVTGGSDFHSLEPGRMPAMPCTCIYAESTEAEDLLEGLKSGHTCIALSPKGPFLQVPGKGRLPGDTLLVNTSLELEFTGLKKGDCLFFITNGSTEKIVCDKENVKIKRIMEKRGYCRAEIRRELFPGTESLVFVSNPWYIVNT